MKILLASIVAIMVFSAFVFFSNTKPSFKLKELFVKSSPKKIVKVNENLFVKSYANKIKPFLKTNKYCEDYCFLINMKLPSGKKRFFIYGLKNDSILNAGLVTHGGGSETSNDSLQFSNVPNGNATSLGKYKIGNEYSGRFGMAFKLHGLERSNSKAFERFVVLHSHACVPLNEVYPQSICTSLGCPTVSPAFLTELKKYIDKADKPVVLWIYY